MPLISALALALMTAFLGLAGEQSHVTKESVPGITNFARAETTVACGGVITPSAIAEIKQRGYRAVFDLQLPDEKGADIDGEAAAAKAAGVNFHHVPFTPSKPDTAVVDRFVTLIVEPDNQPAFIHCSGGNRAAGFWLIKRVVVDNWTLDNALEEAEGLGLQRSGPMRQFALDYIGAHKQ